MSSISSSMRIRLTGCKGDGLETFKVVLMFEGSVIEIEEELLCEVEVANEVCTSSYDYDFGTVVLTSFVCHLISGAPHLTEHHEIRWVAPAEMPTLDWAPADREAVRLISAMDFPAFPAAMKTVSIPSSLPGRIVVLLKWGEDREPDPLPAFPDRNLISVQAARRRGQPDPTF